jgi:putative (di)nucleoside polyphosphate hydrolase
MSRNENSDQPKPLGYRPCVGIMVLNRTGLVWLGRRSDAINEAEGRGAWWQMPQGGIDEKEDPRAAALRELYEETQMRSVEVLAEHSDWLTYDLPHDLVGKAWGGRYKGQKQKWFAVRLTGPESEIDISPPPGHQQEFDAWRWAPVDEVLDVIVPFKRTVYERVLAEFGALTRTG